MKAVLWQLYHGRVYPGELPAPKSQKYREALNLLVEQEEAFNKAYNAAFPELKQILDSQRNVCAQETEDMFYYGFCLGIKLIVEAMYRKE